MFAVHLFTADDKRMESVRAVRRSVFIKSLGVPEDEEFDRYDEYGQPALFALLTEEDVPCGTGRLVISKDNYKIGRIAFLPQCRGKGYGTVLVKTLLQKAFSMGAECVFVDARDEAVPFYKKIGFAPFGDYFEERGMTHLPMRIRKEELRSCGGTQNG